MRGLVAHFRLTLTLNFKSRQALVYGYLVPVFFLIAFGSIFRAGNPPLLRQLGQLLTISILGGACFGMPTAMVAERERGVWRRYRLLPTATGSLVISTMAARFLIILSAAIMQIILASLMYGMPVPEHPLQMFAAFTVVTFAFLGMGLIIAMLADSVPAVQALGQAIFLPMIMIGGVGVPLWTLPAWAQHLAGFLPGKYAVQALQSCAMGGGLFTVGFDLAALVAIGIAACIASAKMFRWDAHEKPDPRQRRWVFLALLIWLAVGFTAEFSGHAQLITSGDSAGESYESITPAQIAAVTYDTLEADSSTVTPLLKSLDNLEPEALARANQLRAALDIWPGAKASSLTRRVRNLLDAACVADITQNRYEGLLALIVFQKLQADVPQDQLEKILTWIIQNPADDSVIIQVPELGIEGNAPAQDVRDRTALYAAKFLGRLTGKRPAE